MWWELIFQVLLEVVVPGPGAPRWQKWVSAIFWVSVLIVIVLVLAAL